MTTNAFKSQYFCWTLNNPTVDEFTRAKTLHGDLQYTIFQVEKGANETIHLQGYSEFKRVVTFNVAKQDIGDRDHLEKRRGSQSQAIDYCKKPDTFVSTGGMGAIFGRHEIGTPKKIGSGVGPGGVVELIKDLSISLSDVFEAQPMLYIKNHSGIEKARELYWEEHKDRPRPLVFIYFGPTGVGKSLFARKEYPNAFHPPWPTGGRWWWPGYDHEEVVILDEFRHQISFTNMIKLLDSGPFVCENKGGNKFVTSDTYVITTNLNPFTEWYRGKDAPSDLSPLYRRLEEFAAVYEFSWDKKSKNEDGTPKSVMTLRKVPHKLTLPLDFTRDDTIMLDDEPQTPLPKTIQESKDLFTSIFDTTPSQQYGKCLTCHNVIENNDHNYKWCAECRKAWARTQKDLEGKQGPWGDYNHD